MRKKKVCLIGRIAPGVDLFDGQTIKTRLLFDQLTKNTKWKIVVVDTYFKKRKVRMLFKTFFSLLRCKDVFICLSTNGLSVYYKILKFFICLRRTRVFHYVVGGNHHQYLMKHKSFIKTCKKFKVNWVQTINLVNELNKLGINNAKYMPNFKPMNPVDVSTIPLYTNSPFRFVTFSRITKTKGIDIAAEVIKRINDEFKDDICSIDVYGAVEDNFKDEFNNLLKNNKYVNYCGTRGPFESAQVLKDYFALLFPTYWPSEGFAATILDAYFAGIPVIATDWNCNSEIVNDGKTGFIYPNNKFKTLYDCVKFAISNPNVMNAMKPNCIEFAKEFTPDKYIKEIISFVEGK